MICWTWLWEEQKQAIRVARRLFNSCVSEVFEVGTGEVFEVGTGEVFEASIGEMFKSGIGETSESCLGVALFGSLHFLASTRNTFQR